MTPYYERGGIVIYHGDARDVMPTLEAGSVDLVVTSPPYDNLRTYEGYTFNFEAISAALVPVLSTGGVLVWVVGDETKNGSESGTSFRQALRFTELGLNLHDTMIYEKNGPAHPDDRRYYQVFEFMFVFSNGKPKTFNPIVDRKVKYPFPWGKKTDRQKTGNLSDSTTYYKGRELGWRFNIWRFNTGKGFSTKDETAFEHPATFPEALARDHILSWSNAGDTVLDPMCGSGTTLKMAKIHGRRAIGIDVSERYCQIAADRLSQEVMQL